MEKKRNDTSANSKEKKVRVSNINIKPLNTPIRGFYNDKMHNRPRRFNSNECLYINNIASKYIKQTLLKIQETGKLNIIGKI